MNVIKIRYFGRIKPRGEKLHYHYNCVRDLEYVKKAVNKNPGCISLVYLIVEGLEK